jgi:hypothetical protein
MKLHLKFVKSVQEHRVRRYAQATSSSSPRVTSNRSIEDSLCPIETLAASSEVIGEGVDEAAKWARSQ